jgi:hypothetical protein
MTSKLIKVMQETTEWSDGGSNHTYIFKDKPTGRSAKAIAYIPAGSKIVQRFKKPIDLDLKGRTFVELTD